MRRTRRRKSQKHVLSGMLGLLCAGQDVGNVKKCTFRNSGTPVRRTRRQKSQKINTFGHTFGTHLEHIEHIWNILSTLGHIWKHLWETTESAKAFLSPFAVLGNKLQGNHVWETTEQANAFFGQHLLFGELVIEDGGTGSLDVGEPVPPAFLTDFYS